MIHRAVFPRAARMIATTAALAWTLPALSLNAANFTTGTGTATKFGVHEISLAGNGAVANPDDTIASVTFTAPSGATRTMPMFYSGGDTWKARCYVSETGGWTWTSTSSNDSALTGKSGSFSATASSLRGKLKKHTSNAKQWMTDDGQTFITISDTAYYLFSDKNLAGATISEASFQDFVADSAAHEVNLMRAVVAGSLRNSTTWNYWFSPTKDRINLTTFTRTDDRMIWMLNNHPGMYVQLTMVPEAPGYKSDQTFWTGLTVTQRNRYLRNVIGRYAAFPTTMWLVANDHQYLSSSNPRNRAMATEIGTYLMNNDPYGNLRSTGPTRNEAFPFAGSTWVSYIHIETSGAFAASAISTYASHAKHVFCGEDQYEREGANNPKYFFRWLFWSWILSGGSANYGGISWDEVAPYDTTGQVGLDSVQLIPAYFSSRGIDVAAWTPEDALATDADGATGDRRVQAMRKGFTELLAYHPCSSSVSISFSSATPNLKTTAARLTVNLASFSGTFSVEWYRTEDGVVANGSNINGGGNVTLTAPWAGKDVVLYIKPTTGSVVQEPYPGPAPASLPGTIQAENFDTGGQGLAYNDSTGGNAGPSTYRSGTDVDIESTTDTGGGVIVGWITAGEWLEYTATVPSNGVYNLSFRVAALDPGKSFRMEVDNVDVTGEVQVPDTNGWQAFQTVTKTGINLTAGTHVFKMYAISANFNFNWFSVAAATGGTTVTYECENLTRTTSGETNSVWNDANCSGGKFNQLYATGPGGYIEYSVNVAAQGTYTVLVRSKNHTTRGKYQLRIGANNQGGVIDQYASPISYTEANLGSVTLNAGIHLFRFTVDSKNPLATAHELGLDCIKLQTQ